MKHKPRHALYLLPNIFTTAALFFGFYAIIYAIAGNWQQAAVAVIFSAVLDALDGRVARLTGTTSSFGLEYDSLSDVVAFGVAPAILLFQWSLGGEGKIGFVAAFCYCAATALRLARFNTQAGVVDRRFFIGLPSPAAAALLVSFVACADRYRVDVPVYAVFALCLLMAATMVSGVRFYSFKTLNVRARLPLYAGLLLMLGMSLLHIFSNDWMAIILSCLLAYTASGYCWAVWLLLARRWRKG